MRSACMLWVKVQVGFVRLSPSLDEREKAGKVRRCHGDLHLRNFCLLDGSPTLFDCLEFDDDLATTDVLYDLAFLLMDLWHLGLRTEANWLFNRYFDAVDEDGGVPSCLSSWLFGLLFVHMSAPFRLRIRTQQRSRRLAPILSFK